MTIYPAFKGFAFEKENYESLLARFLAIPGYQQHLLGYSVGGRPIYGFSLGDLSKPVMFVQGNIHGYHEWRTCWWVSEFMRVLAQPLLSPDHVSILSDLRSKYSFYFIPSVNPDGYGTPEKPGRYGNGHGVSVSENFDFNWNAGIHVPPHDEYRGPSPFSEPESQIVRDKVSSLRPVSLLCTHTWGSSNVGFMSRRPQNPDYTLPFSSFWADIRSSLGYGPDIAQRLELKLPSGSAYNWAGTLTSSLGLPTIGQVWEAGGGLTAVDQSRVGMTGILYHMLMVDQIIPAQATTPNLQAISSNWGPLQIGGNTFAVSAIDLSLARRNYSIWRR